MSQISINIRMDESLKQEFESLCNELGLTMTSAVNIFARAVVRKQGIPFEISKKTTNPETIAAIEEVQEMKRNPQAHKSFNSVKELFEDLNSDD